MSKRFDRALRIGIEWSMISLNEIVYDSSCMHKLKNYIYIGELFIKHQSCLVYTGMWNKVRAVDCNT